VAAAPPAVRRRGRGSAGHRRGRATAARRGRGRAAPRKGRRRAAPRKGRRRSAAAAAAGRRRRGRRGRAPPGRQRAARAAGDGGAGLDQLLRQRQVVGHVAPREEVQPDVRVLRELRELHLPPVREEGAHVVLVLLRLHRHHRRRALRRLGGGSWKVALETLHRVVPSLLLRAPLVWCEPPSRRRRRPAGVSPLHTPLPGPTREKNNVAAPSPSARRPTRTTPAARRCTC
jgi:hypothetical protein